MRHLRPIAVTTSLLLLAAACSSSSGKSGAASSTTTAPKANAAPVSLGAVAVDAATQTRCDPISSHCPFPLPNDHFTVTDSTTPTGRRLAIDRASMPANTKGVHVDVTDENRADGWSPGSTMLVELDGVDLAQSHAPTIADQRHSLDPDSPIVVLDATTGARHPFWAELDANADARTQPVLIVHPARNFPDGHRIVVAMRNLVDHRGARLAPSPAFAAYRDGQRTTDATFEARRAEMERIFSDLARAGVGRSDLQLAWDFTVASTQSLTGRLLAIRDDAFRVLGSSAPVYTVDKVTENPDPHFIRRVEGTFRTPLYLTDGGAPGGRLVLDAHGVPKRQSGSFTAHYTCNIPAAARAHPARMALYGHGLLGDRSEVNGDLTQTMAADNDIVYCATDWYGMAEQDIANAAEILQDLSKFPSLADRLQQGLLAFLFLGRLMKHPDGFSANPAFRFGAKPALDPTELYYDGNSQGAILGGALTAVAADITRSVLAEAGMNYSLLLDRSVDFDEYLAVLRAAYPRRVDRLVGIEVAQLLWDRGETDGYANHITADPLPGTPRHDVVLIGAVGDHQVTEYSLRVEAATLGVHAHVPIAAPGRIVGTNPWLSPLGYPSAGSSYWLWDTGSPRSPAANIPPRAGHDPHDDTPNIPAVRDLKNDFWHPNGAVTDVCNGRPCTAPVPPQNAD